MNKNILLILLLSIMFPFSSVNAADDELEPSLQKLPEAFRDRVKAASTHFTNDWVLRVADSLEQYSKEKNDDHYILMASMIRSHNAFVNSDSTKFLQNNNIVLEISEKYKYYDNFFTESTNRVSFYLNTASYYAALKYARFLTSKAKAIKSPIGLFSGYHSLGNIYEKLGMYNKALSSFLEAEKSIQSLSDDDKYQSHLKYCRQNIAFDYLYLEDYEMAEKKCLELLDADPLDIRSLGVLSAVFFKTGRYDDFKEIKRKIDNIDTAALGNKAQSYDYIKANVDILALAHDGKMDEAIKLAETRSFIEEQNRKIDVFIYTNRWEEAYYCHKALSAHYDSISLYGNEKDLNEINAELNNLYEISERDNKITNLMYHVTIGFMLIIIIVIICIYFIRRSMIISKNNKILAANLDQMLEYKEMFMKEMGDRMERNSGDKFVPGSDDDSSSKNIDDSSTKHQETFEDVTRYVYELSSRKLFTNPDFDKSTLLAELGIHRSNFYSDFEKQTGCTITKYVLKLRMEYAAKLIKDNPEYTLEAIAGESGILSRTTFYRNFTNFFGITPSAYRNEHCDH